MAEAQGFWRILQAGFDFPGVGHNFPPVNPPGRNFYIAFGGCIAAMILAAFFVDEDYTLPVVAIFIVAFCGALYRVLWKGILLEATVLGCLLFGYLVGESGFGHLNLGGGGSIYFGEVGLVVCFLIFGMRVAFTKERFIQRDPFSLAICAFVLIGSIRFCADFYGGWGAWDYEKTVVRDFATIYYVSFFFITANIFKHERSRRFLEGVFPVAIVFLIPAAAAIIIDPEIYQKLSFHGDQAIIYTRSDLAGSFLGFGAIYFMLSREGRGLWFLRTAAAFFCFALVMMMNSRATILGFGFSTVILLAAGKLRILRGFLVFAVFGALALIAVNAVRPATDEQIATTSKIKDKLFSIVDFGSNKDYETDYGSSKASNNHYRIVWWTAVYNETMENNPVFGLGFGYDLAARFLRIYDLPLDPEDFTARSPHSVMFSILGRMGFIGVTSFGLVIFLMFRGALRCAAAVRKKRVPAIDLAAWCGAITIFVAACFSVMLEGPMAAIVFWSLLGMASYRQKLTTEANEASLSAKPAPRNPFPLRPPLVAAGYR
jgi:O-antigen ligase